MHRASELIGKSVVTVDGGERVGNAVDLLVSSSGDHLVGIVVGGGLLGSERVLPYGDVQALGQDAIVARTQHRVMDASEWRTHGVEASRSSSLKDKRVVTDDGREVGAIKDIYVDERTGAVEAYDVIDRIFARLISRRRVLPRSGDVTVGRDVVVVSAAAAEALRDGAAEPFEDTAGEG